MGWDVLGGNILSYDWQLLNQPVIGSETFKISQNFAIKPIGKAWIVQVFPDGYYGFRSFIPDKTNSLILELSIPEKFEKEGIVTRYLALKMASRTRVFNFDWQVTVEAFY